MSLGVLMLLGCGGSGTGGHCPLPGTLTSANIVDALVTADICYMAGCSPIADGILTKAKATPYSALETASYSAALAAGTLSIDVAHAGPCLAAVANGCHGQSFKPPPECRNVLVPHQSAGATCFTSFDCVDGYCQNFDQPGGCPGTCSDSSAGCTAATDCGPWETCVAGACGPGASSGEACVQDEDCAVGLVCAGKACAGPGGAGALCNDDADCAIGFFCKLSSPGPLGNAGNCAAMHGTGQACSPLESALACGYGSYCGSFGNLTGPSKCVAYGAAGAACQLDQEDFIVPTCQAGLNCTDAGCALPPESGPCAGGSGEYCDLQLYCDSTDTCRPYRADGDACDTGEIASGGAGDCASGVCNDAGVCVAPGSFCPAGGA